MKTVRFTLISALFLMLTACNSQIEWQQNQALWSTQAKSYVYTLRTVPATFDTVITVKDNKVVSAYSVTPLGFNVPIVGTPLTLLPTIDQQFLAMAPQLISETFEATYHETYGYPTRFTNLIPDTQNRAGIEIANVTFN
ncbi:MAG: DUF6174 domain-containing protein [Pseudomonadota bacterium]